jgi:hypothetical protein
MPFQTTALAPPTNPRVTIAFSGLMVVRSGANNTCEVGMHRFNTSHECRVTLIVRKPNRPATLVPLVKGPFEGPVTISRELAPDPLMGDFAVFAPTTDPFIRDAATNHELDYRWAVGLREIHPDFDLDLNEGAQPLVTLKTGILYTANLTKDGLNPQLETAVKPEPPEQPPPAIPLHKIASNLAAAIILRGADKLLLKWRDFGNDRTFELPRGNDHPNTRYTVMFTNEPPKINAEPHDEMALYYRILQVPGFGFGVFSEQQMTLTYGNRSMTDEVPCLSLRIP